MFPRSVFEGLLDKPLVVDANRGHGKSQLIKALVAEALEQGYIVKVFDCVVNWYHDSPLLKRQLIRNPDQYTVIDNCVYECGSLSQPQFRRFIASIIKHDYNERYEHKLVDPKYVDSTPRVLYIIEEANTVIKSQALNRKGWEADILNNFISRGRNLGLDVIFIATRVGGEVSPGFRNRCDWILGRVSGKEEKTYVGKATDDDTLEIAKKLPKYKFVYYDGDTSEPFYLPETIYHTPATVEPPPEPVIEEAVVIENKRGQQIWPTILFILLCLIAWLYGRGG